MKPVSFAYNPTAPPLTPAEMRWLRRVNKLLQECPSTRMAAATMGDSYLTFYDKEAEAGQYNGDMNGDFIPFIKSRGFALADVSASFLIDSTAA